MPPAAVIPAGFTDVIRPAGPDDMAAVTAIYRQAVLEETGTFEIDPPDATEMTARYTGIVDGGFPFLVASERDDVLGYAYVAAYRARPAYRFTVEDSIYVAPNARGKNIGRALLDALLEESMRRGFRQMVAVIGDSSNHGSIQLHARAGFAHAGVLVASGWKHGRWLDVVLMQRALGAGAGAPAT